MLVTFFCAKLLMCLSLAMRRPQDGLPDGQPDGQPGEQQSAEQPPPAAREECIQYEVCKCTTQFEEEQVRCEPETCSYRPGVSPTCPAPTCEVKAKAMNDGRGWSMCEWRNYLPDLEKLRMYGDYELPDYRTSLESYLNGANSVRVYTDIDDTVKCSKGIPPKGIQKECGPVDPEEGRVFYKHVVQFQHALAAGQSGNLERVDVVPITARPENLVGTEAAINHLREYYRKKCGKLGLGNSWSLVDFKHVLFGSLAKGLQDQMEELTRQASGSSVPTKLQDWQAQMPAAPTGVQEQVSGTLSRIMSSALFKPLSGAASMAGSMAATHAAAAQEAVPTELKKAAQNRLAQFNSVVANAISKFSFTSLTPYRNMGYLKYAGWKQRQATFVDKSNTIPAASYGVFVGDNGQGDLVAAQMMRIRSQVQARTPEPLAASFIHDVQGLCTAEARKKDPSSETWCARFEAQGIFHFDTYDKAVEKAKQLGLISAEFKLLDEDAAAVAAAPAANAGGGAKAT
eukprot:TRINITY_DN73132_c0_g1_i1.p1 TRINITY_DN73132_c0_g1~~TRINITY_DN73132_c0_g1_i1.p1  ORF type:complete len:527 (+),score=60.90 TRINITY_DN73132_c0_g1_i1:43-1581(+)